MVERFLHLRLYQCQVNTAWQVFPARKKQLTAAKNQKVKLPPARVARVKNQERLPSDFFGGKPKEGRGLPYYSQVSDLATWKSGT